MFQTESKIRYSKEKEFTLSLLRIPITFFSQDKSQKKGLEATSNAKIDEVKNTDTSTSPEKTVQMAPGEDIKVNIEFNTVSQNSNNNSKSPVNSTPSPTPQTDEKSNEEPDEDDSESKKDSKENEEDDSAKKAIRNPSDRNAPAHTPQPDDNATTPKASPKPTSPSSNTQPKDNSSKPKDEPKDNKSEKTSKEKSPDTKKPDDEKKKKADDLKKKFGNTKPVKKLNNAKNRALDKISKTPVASKLNQAKNIKRKVDNAKEAIQNIDMNKMSEVAGDTAVKAVEKAATAVDPAVGKAITVADKTLGKTKVGKTIKKAIGACCCAAGCLLPATCILLIVVIIMAPFMWITNLFGNHSKSSDIYGDELSSSEYELLEEASTEFSMQDYTDLTKNLNNSSWLQSTFAWWTTSKYPIQEATEEYINNRYTYTAEQAKNYNKKYKSLIEKGYVFSVEEGDLTSFGMSFESIISHYTISNLKLPSSAPKRIKEINGEKVTYTTYDPKGTHQSLFEEVLTDPENIARRFKEQLDPDWLTGSYNFGGWLTAKPEDNYPDPDWSKISINAILDAKVPNVYVEDANEERTLSLRDLLKDTSVAAYDSEYYTDLVLKIIDIETSLGNVKIGELCRQLQKKLAALELMTYMLAYQKYDAKIEGFLYTISNCENKALFESEEFWAQFLTFSNVEHFIAIASLADHSLAYDIACESIVSASESIDATRVPNGGRTYVVLKSFSNWYGTYEFDTTNAISSDNGAIIYNLSNPKVTPTDAQEYLFDKYNVGFGLYDKYPDMTGSENPSQEEIKARNQNAFFALFEAATGIEMSTVDNEGKLQVPSYEITKKGISPIRISSSASSAVSMGFGQEYSSTTVAKYGLTHTNHTGIDYAVPTGTPVVATSSGTAYITRGNTGYGNYVKILHDDGYTSIYAHGNGTFYVTNGSRVQAGQTIMQSGNSGNSTGPHLHFEVRNSSGTPVNPTTYLYTNA